MRLKCDGTRAETRFRLSAKRTSPFKSTGASVQSTTGSRGVRMSGSNAGYTTFRGRVKSTGYPLHLPVSPSLPLPCVTVCHHISSGLYISAVWYSKQGERYESRNTITCALTLRCNSRTVNPKIHTLRRYHLQVASMASLSSKPLHIRQHISGTKEANTKVHPMNCH